MELYGTEEEDKYGVGHTHTILVNRVFSWDLLIIIKKSRISPVLCYKSEAYLQPLVQSIVQPIFSERKKASD